MRTREVSSCPGLTTCPMEMRRSLITPSNGAVITVSVDGAVRVRDLGSTNGIYVNGVRRAESQLRAGDSVRLGGTIITYLEEVEDSGTSTTEMAVVEAQSAADQTGFDPPRHFVGRPSAGASRLR